MKSFKAFILTNATDEYWRGLLRGMISYVQLHKDWELFLSPYDILPSPQQIAKWGMVGIITRPELYPSEKWRNRMNAPILFFDNYPRGWQPEQRKNIIGKIVADEEAVAQMAFHFFANQGAIHFAYIGSGDRKWSIQRKTIFCRLVKEAGHEPLVFLCPEKRISRNRYRQLKDWLISLPKPVSILACNDIFGRVVLATCYNAGLKVPDDISVLGVDNDSMLCEMSIPSLSSIVMDTEQAGYNAMGYLEKVLRDRQRIAETGLPDEVESLPERQTFTSVPVRVVTRESTKKQRFADDNVNTAWQFILHNGHDPIRVDDIVKMVPVSKRILQIQFKKQTGMSLEEMILKVRLDNLIVYLKETRFSIKQIAQKMQFATPSHLIYFFRKAMGETPTAFRKRDRE